MFPISKTRTLKLRILSKATQLGCRIWFQPPVSLNMRPVLLGEMAVCKRRQLSQTSVVMVASTKWSVRKQAGEDTQLGE